MHRVELIGILQCELLEIIVGLSRRGQGVVTATASSWFMYLCLCVCGPLVGWRAGAKILKDPTNGVLNWGGEHGGSRGTNSPPKFLNFRSTECRMRNRYTDQYLRKENNSNFQMFQYELIMREAGGGGGRGIAMLVQ